MTEHPRHWRDALRNRLAAATAVCVWALAIYYPDFSWAGSTGVYQTTPDSGPGNTASPVGGGSIAIGINSQSSSPTSHGDSIAIGVDTAATNQDTIAIGAQTEASGVNAIALGNNTVDGSLIGTWASGDNSMAFGVNSIASGNSSITFGANSLAPGAGAIAFGTYTNAMSDFGIALGYGAYADRNALNGAAEAFSGTAVHSLFGALSIGQSGFERQITNVAGGTQDTDAVNVRQLRAVGNQVYGTLGGGGGYNATTDAYTAPTFTVGGVGYSQVASAFAATASNNLAVQYTSDGSGNPTNVVDLTKGGSLSPVSLTGLAPATTNSGAVSLGQLPLQYSTSANPTTANPAASSNDVTLIGTSGQPVTLHNVNAGAVTAGSTDAVNGAQLYSTNQAIAAISSGSGFGLLQQDATTRNINVGAVTDGTTVDFTNQTGTARTLQGVAGGQIASGSMQAINGDQAYSQAAAVAQSLGGGSTVNADGTVSAPSYDVLGQSYSSVGGAVGALDTAVSSALSTNRYVAVNSNGAAAVAAGTDAVAIGQNATAASAGGVALGANALALRGGLSGADEDFSGISVASTAGAVSVGDVGAERQITNVAGGTQDTDAVNVRQLKAVGTQVATALGGGATLNPDGSLQGPNYTVDGRTYSSVGGAVTALDNTGVKYDVDPATGARGNSVTLAGGDPDQPVLIRNVATGVAPTDAANTGQIAAAQAAAFAYTDQQVANIDNRLAGLQSQIAQSNREAHEGAAIGIAAASLRFDDRPGKLSTAIGTGYWKGEVATAMGIGYSLPDGSTRINATATTTGTDFGIAAGASFTLN